MSIVYTADVFCDGNDCSQWTNGVTGAKPPEKWRVRMQARAGRWVRVGGKDYCPACAKAQAIERAQEKA